MRHWHEGPMALFDCDDRRHHHRPLLMPVLSKGEHRNPAEGACFMEYASLLAGEEFSDHPGCAHPVLAELARSVNDRLPDSERHRIAHLIPAVIGTADYREDETERRVLSVRLVAWCARQVQHLTVDRAAALAAIEAAEAWADCPCEAHQSDAANAAYAAGTDTPIPKMVSGMVGSSSSIASTAYAAASTAYAAASHIGNLVALLEGAFAEHARLTGRDALPTLTEDDARRVVERLAAS